jgi:hypothetical protein
MNINYYIGVGGTGARLAEALVHLCAAGLGPDKLHLFLVDPDQANGNLARTLDLIKLYQRCQKRYAEVTSDVEHRPFGTKIVTPTPEVWSIFDQEDVKLSEYVNLENLKQSHPAYADFIRILFTEDELQTQLNEGFRGHPSIGAVTMANVREEQEPWKSFWENVENCQQPNQVRVFLSGSIFGGTGAAGVPTFGAREVLKYHEAAKIDDDTSKIHLGGALVLPYFSFDVDPEAADEEDLFVTAKDFPIATKAALQFYSEKTLAFDELYFVGDSLSQNVGSFSPGSKTQRNRPHYAEIAGALAARDFFAQPRKDETDADTTYYLSARDGARVDWEAMPTTRRAEDVDAEQDLFQRRMAASTAFLYMLCTYGQQILDAPAGSVRDAWYRRNFSAASLDPRSPESRSVLDDVTTYGRRFLAWITDLSDADAVEIVQGDKLVGDDDADGLPSLLDPSSHPHGLGSFLSSSSSREETFATFRTDMDRVTIQKKSMPAADRYLNVFHEAATAFCQRNYNLADQN